MRNVLTIIAVALVAVMSVALVAPMLVDWSAHRADIEARLHAITGANVSLTGPVEVRLLPTPYLVLGAGSLSAPGAGGPNLSFASARLELALVKLTSGQFRFSDISLEKPVLTIARGAGGGLGLPELPIARLRSTGVDRLIVQDGRLRIVGAGAAADLEIAGVDFDAAGAVPGRPRPTRRTVFRPRRRAGCVQARHGKAESGGDAAARRSGRRAELACGQIRRRARRRGSQWRQRASFHGERRADRDGAGRGRPDAMVDRGTDNRRP